MDAAAQTEAPPRAADKPAERAPRGKTPEREHRVARRAGDAGPEPFGFGGREALQQARRGDRTAVHALDELLARVRALLRRPGLAGTRPPAAPTTSPPTAC